MKILASNRKARHDYFILQKWEAGIVLVGTEIKSLREGQASIAESWIKESNGDLWLIGAMIPPYSQAKDSWATHEPTRDRKLLLHKVELNRIHKDLPGHTLIPLDIHLNENNFAKVTVALCRGKKSWDKRETIKERDFERYGD